MKDVQFRVWHIPENKMYYRGYQKLLHVLLCEDDHGANEGKGNPAKRAKYKDCLFLESTGLHDKNGKEVFEGDRVRVRLRSTEFEGTVDSVPDSFGNKNVHPLGDLLKKNGILGNPQDLEVEVLGNEFENSR